MSHDTDNGDNTKKFRFAGLTKTQKKAVKALQAKVQATIEQDDSTELDEIVKGFHVLGIVPHEKSQLPVTNVTALNIELVKKNSFAYDTGAAEGISTNREDFLFLDESDEAKKSIRIKGPSVGAPRCEGRFIHG